MKVAPTVSYDIFIAGDVTQAKQACREYCFEVGLCVTVETVDFIYTGGEETGIRIGLINYPRFPSSQSDLELKARELADVLMKRLCQHSYSIVGPTETFWFSRRSEPKIVSPQEASKRLDEPSPYADDYVALPRQHIDMSDHAGKARADRSA